MSIAQTLCSSFKLDLLTTYFAVNNFKIALYTSAAALNAATPTYTSVGEVVGTGYTAGGIALSEISPVLSGTTACASFQPAVWPAATFTARGALVYNVTNGNLAVAVLNFGSDITCTGLTFTVTFPAEVANTAIIQIQ